MARCRAKSSPTGGGGPSRSDGGGGWLRAIPLRHALRARHLPRWGRIFAVAFSLSTPALAQTTVTSETPTDIAVTIYRDPYRDSGMMNAGWPGGYALISETRTISIPKGDSRIRFENVAEGLLPETALVSGLPSGVREKNRDARLISPAGLVDAYLKRRVLFRRTDPATGRVSEGSAVIQAGPDGGVVLRTDAGFEALRCSGLPERMIYPQVPDTLSARPTLSILTRSDRARTATIQLTYMAQGFDWSANYVGNVRDGGKLGLFAWLTVANGGQQSFKDARLQVIAGKPNKRENNPPPPPPQAWLNLQCWPADITSTAPIKRFVPLPLPSGYDFSRFNNVGKNAPGSFESKKQRKKRLKREQYRDEDGAADVVVTGTRAGSVRGGFARRSRAMAPPPPPPPPPPAPMMEAPLAISVVSSETINVAAQAQVEALGDLKLYRVPMRVTVAAQAQKQVAMLVQPDAAFARLYVINVGNGGPSPQPAPFILRGRNVSEAGLGVPLPAGSVALFERGGGRNLLVGEYPLSDLAVGEEVELSVGQSPDVTWTLTRASEDKNKQQWRVDISNARDVPISVEVIVPFDLEDKPPGLERGRGGWKLPVTVAANDRASVGYSVKLR